ncbi:MAG: TIGR03086 family protein, partial [Marmoricola sp.]
DEDMEEYVTQLAADHLIHGWDLAVATGGDAELDQDLVIDVAAWFAEREEIYRSAGAVGAHAAAGGDAQSNLLASFGRDSRWAGGTD